MDLDDLEALDGLAGPVDEAVAVVCSDDETLEALADLAAAPAAAAPAAVLALDGVDLADLEALEDLGRKTANSKALLLADTLNQAIGASLDNNKSPSRKVRELDNRGSHFYLALYWAQALAAQSQDADLQAEFAPLAQALASHEAAIIAELNAAQGQPVDIGGYYHPNDEKATKAMRPSATFNAVLAA